MSKIDFAHATDHPFRKVASFAPEAFRRILSEDDLETEVRTLFPGSEEQLSLIEVKDIANGRTAQHAHVEDEIFFVLEGEIHFGKRVCTAGDAIHIRGGTLYSYVAGPEGARYLKFNGRADHSFISREQYEAQREKRGVGS